MRLDCEMSRRLTHYQLGDGAKTTRSQVDASIEANPCLHDASGASWGYVLYALMAFWLSGGVPVVSQTRETLRHTAAAQHKSPEQHVQCHVHFAQHAVRYKCVACTRALDAMTSNSTL